MKWKIWIVLQALEHKRKLGKLNSYRTYISLIRRCLWKNHVTQIKTQRPQFLV